MIGNGTAQKIESNTYKKFYASVNAKLLNKKLLLEIYGDFENQTKYISKYTIKGFIGFQNSQVTFGFEPFQQITTEKNRNDKIDLGASIFARATILPNKLQTFVRYDIFNPAMLISNYNERFILAGLDFMPSKNVHIIPNIWIITYTSINSAPSRNSDIVGRITLWYKFN